VEDKRWKLKCRLGIERCGCCHRFVMSVHGKKSPGWATYARDGTGPGNETGRNGSTRGGTGSELGRPCRARSCSAPVIEKSSLPRGCLCKIFLVMCVESSACGHVACRSYFKLAKVCLALNSIATKYNSACIEYFYLLYGLELRSNELLCIR